MRFVSLRRAVPACAAAAAVLAFGVPGIASAKEAPGPKTDVLPQCEGASLIEGNGSTFQAPVEYKFTGWQSEENKELSEGFNHPKGKLGCGGSLKPEVRFNQEETFDRGSGACLKTWGEGISTFGEKKSSKGKEETYPRVSRYPFCGTDEAPKQSVKEGMEGILFSEHEAGFESGEGKEIESLPFAQGAEAMITNLPKHCLASSEVTTAQGKTEKLGRLALDQNAIAGIYEGTIKTWKEAIEKQELEPGGKAENGDNALECKGGAEGIKYIEGGVEKELTGTEKATPLEEEEEIIRPVVRADKSGTTHIFKAFLLQVNTADNIPMEKFEEVNGGEKPCKTGELGAGAVESWQQVSEGCENQRWPEEAHVLRPTETGNPGVVNEVNKTESSIGYADLSVAQDFKFFDTKVAIAGEKGGENKIGSITKQGEKNKKFWAVVQDSKPGTTPVTYEDPQTKGDVEKFEESNCKETVYTAAIGQAFPPKSTQSDWSKVKGYNVSKTYPICGLTYILAARQYWYFLKKYGVSETESRKIATAVHDYAVYAVSPKGGGKLLKKSDYEPLPTNVDEEAVLGAEGIGNKEGAPTFTKAEEES